MQRNAKTLNWILSQGGEVVISNGRKATRYTSIHVGIFHQGKSGNVYTKLGNRQTCLTSCNGQLFLVRIDATLPENVVVPDCL